MREDNLPRCGFCCILGTPHHNLSLVARLDLTDLYGPTIPLDKSLTFTLLAAKESQGPIREIESNRGRLQFTNIGDPDKVDRPDH